MADDEDFPVRRLPPESSGAPSRWQDIPKPEGGFAARRTAGVSLYPRENLYREMAFLAYYLHWSDEALMALDHRERRRWCREVSAINKKLSGNEGKSIEFR